MCVCACVCVCVGREKNIERVGEINGNLIERKEKRRKKKKEREKILTT